MRRGLASGLRYDFYVFPGEKTSDNSHNPEGM